MFFSLFCFAFHHTLDPPLLLRDESVVSRDEAVSPAALYLPDISAWRVGSVPPHRIDYACMKFLDATHATRNQMRLRDLPQVYLRGFEPSFLLCRPEFLEAFLSLGTETWRFALDVPSDA